MRNRTVPKTPPSPTGITEQVIRQGKVLVRAIESLEAGEIGGPLEAAATSFLLEVYRRRPRGIAAGAPGWVMGEILSASDRIGDVRPVQWISSN